MKPEEKFRTVSQLKNAFAELKANPNCFSEDEIDYLKGSELKIRNASKLAFQSFEKQVKVLQNIFSKIFDNISRELNISIKLQKELAERNWYLPFWELDGDFFLKLSPLVLNNDLKTIDKRLLDFYKSEFDKLFTDIIRAFPNRSLPLTEAYNAHKEGKYFLCIPVYFAQIDGIFEDLTGVRLFKIKNEKGNQTYKHRDKIEQIYNSDFMHQVLIPILEVRESSRLQDKSKPSGLNRHDVMHGSSNDYGNEINSFKVFSLLCYVYNTLHKYPFPSDSQ